MEKICLTIKIYFRYKIKSSHYPSPGINKRHHSTEHSMQPGTSVDAGSGVGEGTVATNGKRSIMRNHLMFSGQIGNVAK